MDKEIIKVTNPVSFSSNISVPRSVHLVFAHLLKRKKKILASHNVVGLTLKKA
jgi:hypothetical protein